MEHPAISTAATLLADKDRKSDELRRELLKLQVKHQDALDQLAIATRQEELTHDCLHDWRDTASQYYMSLQWLKITIPKLLADLHSPAAVLDQMVEFLTHTLDAKPYPGTAEARAQAAAQTQPDPSPTFGLKLAQIRAHQAQEKTTDPHR